MALFGIGNILLKSETKQIALDRKSSGLQYLFAIIRSDYALLECIDETLCKKAYQVT